MKTLLKKLQKEKLKLDQEKRKHFLKFLTFSRSLVGYDDVDSLPFLLQLQPSVAEIADCMQKRKEEEGYNNHSSYQLYLEALEFRRLWNDSPTILEFFSKIRKKYIFLNGITTHGCALFNNNSKNDTLVIHFLVDEATTVASLEREIHSFIENEILRREPEKSFSNKIMESIKILILARDMDMTLGDYSANFSLYLNPKNLEK